MSFIQCSSSLFENRPISIHPWLPGVRSQYTWGKITVVCTLLCGWLHERARWMKPSGLIGYPCWSGECNVVLSWLSTASRKNDVFSPDKMYKTSCIKRHKIFGKNENENFTNSFLNFRKKNKMEILLFKVIIQFWKRKWKLKFFREFNFHSFFNVVARSTTWRCADHVMLASAAKMAERDPTEHMVVISKRRARRKNGKKVKKWIFFPNLNNELKNKISISLNSLNLNLNFSKIWKKKSKNLRFYFYKKWKMNFEKWVVKFFSIFNRNEKWKWTKIFISHF